jgi:hypothetical protein
MPCHHRTVSIKAAPKTDSRLAARCAALASLGASAIHYAVVPAHWQEWTMSGLFFATLASLQLVWARMVLVRTTTPVLAAGILLNVGAVALWALSRTAGAPFGPHAGMPELVAGADLCALLLQIYVVMGASWIWHRGLNGELISGFASAAVLAGAVGVVTLASTVGIASGQQHGHHGPVEAGAEHHGSGVEHPDHQHDDGSARAVPMHDEPAHAPLPTPGLEVAVAPEAPPPMEATIEPAQPLHDDGDHDHSE